jgi:hypothetical protein
MDSHDYAHVDLEHAGQLREFYAAVARLGDHVRERLIED